MEVIAALAFTFLLGVLFRPRYDLWRLRRDWISKTQTKEKIKNGYNANRITKKAD